MKGVLNTPERPKLSRSMKKSKLRMSNRHENKKLFSAIYRSSIALQKVVVATELSVFPRRGIQD